MRYVVIASCPTSVTHEPPLRAFRPRCESESAENRMVSRAAPRNRLTRGSSSAVARSRQLASSSQQSLGITTYGVFEPSARRLPEAVNHPPSEFLGALVGVGLGHIGVPRWRNPVFRLVSSVAFPLSERLACSFEFALGLGLSIASAFAIPALESLGRAACRAFGFFEGVGGFVGQRPFTTGSFGKGTGAVCKLAFSLSALPKLASSTLGGLLFHRFHRVFGPLQLAFEPFTRPGHAPFGVARTSPKPSFPGG